MALSIFVRFFLFIGGAVILYVFLVSVFSLFVMFNTYQASSGIYIVIVLFLTFKQLLAGENFIALCKSRTSCRYRLSTFYSQLPYRVKICTFRNKQHWGQSGLTKFPRYSQCGLSK